MEYRTLGSTGLTISRIAFGAGPVSQLLVGECPAEQRATIERAIARGINWFDTAATYGAGLSEMNLGRALAELGATQRVHLATKVRLLPADLTSIAKAVRRSVDDSLRRLRVERVALLQLHNSITAQAGDLPTSLTPEQVLGPGGVCEAMQSLQQAGVVEHLGLTGIGQPEALAEVIDSGRWSTIQIPYHLLNPSAGCRMPANYLETNYGNLIARCAGQGMGVMAIRVLAGGALAGQSPSPHTLTTPFFPLELYERDRQRAAQIAKLLPDGMPLEEAAVRFALSHPMIDGAILGLASPRQVDAAVEFAAAGPLDAHLAARFNEAAFGLSSSGG